MSGILLSCWSEDALYTEHTDRRVEPVIRKMLSFNWKVKR